MAVNVNDLYRRYTALEAEVKVANRNWRESAEKAVKALKQITDKDVETLSPIFPTLREVRGYTVEVLMADAHGECRRAQKLFSDMTHYLDQELKHFEDALC